MLNSNKLLAGVISGIGLITIGVLVLYAKYFPNPFISRIEAIRLPDLFVGLGLSVAFGYGIPICYYYTIAMRNCKRYSESTQEWTIVNDCKQLNNWIGDSLKLVGGKFVKVRLGQSSKSLLIVIKK